MNLDELSVFDELHKHRLIAEDAFSPAHSHPLPFETHLIQNALRFVYGV